MKRGFTITELLVGIALLAAIIAGSGAVFAMAVNAQRTSNATADVSQKLRAITDRLTADFAGLQENCPFMIWFEAFDTDGDGTIGPDETTRFDQIMFFANGDFATTRQYNNGSGNVTVAGNTARVYYGQADNITFADRTDTTKPTIQDYKLFKTLARRQHVLTADADLAKFPDPDPANFITSPSAPFVPFQPVPYGNDYFEYDTLSISQWQNILDLVVGGMPVNSNRFIEVCFDNMDDTSGDNIRNKIDGRAGIDLKEENTLHMLMAQGVGSFSVQWSYYDATGQLRWYPSADPDGDGNTGDSDFGPPPAMNTDMFGIYFNMPAGVIADTDNDPFDPVPNDWAAGAVFPEALKFTFTIYDSKGVFKEGKTFTHIVYLD